MARKGSAEDAVQYTSELAGALAVVEESAKGVIGAFGEMSNESRKWNMMSRWLSGTGLWRLQNRFRALGNIIGFMSQAQSEAIKQSLKQADAAVRLSDEKGRLTEALGNLKKTEEDRNKVAEYTAYMGEFISLGYTKEQANIAALSKTKSQYNYVLDKLNQSQKRRLKQADKLHKKAERRKLSLKDQMKQDRENLKNKLMMLGSTDKELSIRKGMLQTKKRLALFEEKAQKAEKQMFAGGRDSKGRFVSAGSLEKKHSAAMAGLELNKKILARQKATLKEAKKENIFGKAKEKRDKKAAAFIAKVKKIPEALGKFLYNGLKLIGKVLLYGTLFGILAWMLIRAVKVAGPNIKQRFQDVKKIFVGLWEIAKIGFSLVWSGITKIADAFKETTLLGFLGKFLGGIGEILLGLLAVLSVIWTGIWLAIGTLAWGIWDSFKEQASGHFFGALLRVLTLAAAIWAAIWLVSIIGAIVALPALLAVAIGAVVVGGIMMLGNAIFKGIGMASGGITTGGMNLVGERGPELVKLPRGSRVYSNADSKRMAGGNTINVNVNGRVGASDAEIRDIARKISSHINIEMNRSSNTLARF